MPTSACGVMIGAELGGRHGGAVEDADGGRVVGVPERRAHHEAVELRLGEPVGAGLLDGVLRGEHEEGDADLPRDAVDGDAALLHDLEEGGLRLRARAVDLVGEHDVREDRAGVELEDALLLVVHADPVMSPGSRSGVNWMRVFVPCTDCAIARASEVLPVPGTSSSSTWPSLSIAVEDQLDDMALAEDRPLHVVGDLAERLREPGRLLLRDGHGRCPSVRDDVGCRVRSPRRSGRRG